ncbi:hypothetical protein SAMN05216299_11826 [Nitrosospira sp. Nsp14]|uniref:DUF2325 domain-containing protein n=1 Tax=Nitrosospira sp. Nsp14 TaxID=1855333 RepID=UPI0008F43363|nr:DUF2325 domain-containing protein [Nitrosospira sp. Nsp14]SFH51589.1 hypothetical protein SAMN05216299_11826 [Nitrosospira sp. Nsp14]
MEHITTSAVSRAALPLLFFKAPRAGAILLVPLRAMRSISAVLIANFQGSSGSGKKHKFLPNVFPLQRAIEQVFRVRGGRVRSGCADPFPTTSRVQAGGRNNSAAFSPAGALADGHQALLERIDLLQRRLADARISVPQEPDWFPLVKTAGACGEGPGATGKRGPHVAQAAKSAKSALHRATCNEKKAIWEAGFDLAAVKLLCVGGRAALYPEYSRLVHASGGILFFYRSDPGVGGEKLSELLAQADMVICPVDCVNHQAYFTVKRYCKYSGTPYVVLDHSDIPTFSKGLAKLAELVSCPGS